ncbi:MAG TPA: hypothetical protein ENJ79_08725 [Gammaproteobacteria bacterium]|nr:hypothetical protein [Gammaproteobacteria bacterium]
MDASLPAWAAIALYLLASTALLMRMGGCPHPACSSRLSVLLPGGGAVVLHLLALYPALFTPEGFNLGFFNAASLTAALTVLLLLLVSLRQPLESLGLLLLPAAAATLALASLWPVAHEIDTSRWQLDIHILFSVLAYSLLLLAAVQALVLAVQDRHLRNRQPGGFIRALPPLAVMERILFRMIGAGFALLTLALLSGLLFLEDIFAQHLAHKTVLSLAGWVIFGVLLWGRWRFGWRGRTAIRWTLSGFVMLALAYFGSKLVLELILGSQA